MDVAQKFETDYASDPIVHLPGGKEGNGWKGRLSEIPLEQAERWIGRPGQNLLRLKPPAEAKQKAEKPVKE